MFKFIMLCIAITLYNNGITAVDAPDGCAIMNAGATKGTRKGGKNGRN